MEAEEVLAIYHLEGIEGEPMCLDFMLVEGIEIPEYYKKDTTIHLLNSGYFKGERKVDQYDKYREVCKYCFQANNKYRLYAVKLTV